MCRWEWDVPKYCFFYWKLRNYDQTCEQLLMLWSTVKKSTVIILFSDRRLPSSLTQPISTPQAATSRLNNWWPFADDKNRMRKPKDFAEMRDWRSENRTWILNQRVSRNFLMTVVSPLSRVNENVRLASLAEIHQNYTFEWNYLIMSH